MWLIHITSKSLELKEFTPPDVPPYAILSHTWENDEITYQEFKNMKIDNGKAGLIKIQKACHLARSKDFEYIWVDTCCIDKSSSAELSEAINSMFEWYRVSSVCFAHISDLPAGTIDQPSTLWRDEENGICRWFRRGWTLQELLAPNNVEFYDREWNFRGDKKDQQVMQRLSIMTGIRNPHVFLNSDTIMEVPVGERMSWASQRQTKRPEDLAYCLLGIFKVNMPLIYGEGMRAFQRLQEEIIKTTTDRSLFCWTAKSNEPRYRGLLAESPAEFESYHEAVKLSRMSVGWSSLGSDPEFSVTNKGIRIDSQLCYIDKRHERIALRCNIPPDDYAVLIPLQYYRDNVYVRICPELIFPLVGTEVKNELIYIAKSVDYRIIRDLGSGSDPILFLNISLHPTAFKLTGVKGWPAQPYELSSSQKMNDKVTMCIVVFRLTHGGAEAGEFSVICQRNASARQSLRYVLVALPDTVDILHRLEGSQEERNAVIAVLEKLIADGRRMIQVDYNNRRTSFFISTSGMTDSLYISTDSNNRLDDEIESWFQRINI
ncbi:HET domain-containing protein [Xylaria arbuscula]|nr:HET domain-containing protein [Xylaria arbuscula]